MGGKIANYHPYPPTPWNGSVRPCLPCGVHMSLGTGKTLTKLHTPHAFNAEY